MFGEVAAAGDGIEEGGGDGDVEIAADEGAEGGRGRGGMDPAGEARELVEESVLGPAEVGGDDVEGAGGEVEADADGAAGVDGVGGDFSGNPSGIGTGEGDAGEDGEAFAPAAETDVGPVGMEASGRWEVGENDASGVGGGVAAAVVPEFADFLEAGDVDAFGDEGACDGAELGELVGYLPGVQVEGEDAEGGGHGKRMGQFAE